MSRSDRLLIVHHSADLDGKFSGMLAKKVFQKYIDNKSADIVGYDYGKDITVDKWLGADGEQYDKFLFIDITPPLSWLEKYKQEIVDEAIKVVICDHHEPKYREILSMFGDEDMVLTGLDYIFYQNFCGAKIFLHEYDSIVTGLMLEYPSQNFRRIKNLEEIIRFVSLYDTWQFAQKSQTVIENTLAIKEYFDMFVNIEELETAFDNIDSISSVILIGELLTEKSKNTAKADVDKGKIFLCSQFIDVWPDLEDKISKYATVYMFPGYPSYYAAQLVQHYDYYIGYSINLSDETVTMNIRSQKTGDASILAKAMNPDGGGHKQAAGCKISLEEFIRLIQS